MPMTAHAACAVRAGITACAVVYIRDPSCTWALHTTMCLSFKSWSYDPQYGLEHRMLQFCRTHGARGVREAPSMRSSQKR